MKKIIFMPFINDENAKEWRKNLEDNFLKSEDIQKINKKIDAIRATKKTYNAGDIKNYYKKLHDEKRPRQEKWLNHLIQKTAELFRQKLEKLNGDSLNADKTVIVCALPEFFWYDINDNNKHSGSTPDSPRIVNYHKPVYLENAVDILTESNELMRLTATYPNMIFFAGTVMWKQINCEDHKDEEVFNSLLIYSGGAYKESITKHHVSAIDGFGNIYKDKNLNNVYKRIKEKAGEATFEAAPVTEFCGLKFTYDICLDFKYLDRKTSAKGEYKTLSTELCRKNGINNVDVNVLICAGMPTDQNYVDTHIISDLLLRCDGIHEPYSQIFVKTGAAENVEVSNVCVSDSDSDPRVEPSQEIK